MLLLEILDVKLIVYEKFPHTGYFTINCFNGESLHSIYHLNFFKYCNDKCKGYVKINFYHFFKDNKNI